MSDSGAAHPSEPVATALADYFVTVDYAAIAPAALAEMRRLVLDHLGIAIGGSVTDTGRIVGEYVCDVGGRAEATVIGRQTAVPASAAAFANSVSSHSLELDDVDELALYHYAPPVMAAALAVGQATAASGSQTLAAALAGCEMMSRLSRAANPSLRNRGFHTTPACGVFGAAIAAARLYRLDRDQTVSALGLAGAQASGLMEMYGPSMQKRINPGPAARNGVVAAQLAARGFTGAATILDGERGFAHAFTDSFDMDALTEELGQTVPVTIEYKPYSCARPIHNAVDAVLELRATHGISSDDVVKIVVQRHPDWSEFHRNPRPSNYHEAQVSLPYSVAVALTDGAALPTQFVNERVGDPDLVRLAAVIRLETDPALPRGVSCRVEVTNRRGDVVSSQIDYPLGSVQRPMTDLALEVKFRALTEPVIGAMKASSIVATINDVGDLDDIGALLGMCE